MGTKRLFRELSPLTWKHQFVNWKYHIENLTAVTWKQSNYLGNKISFSNQFFRHKKLRFQIKNDVYKMKAMFPGSMLSFFDV